MPTPTSLLKNLSARMEAAGNVVPIKEYYFVNNGRGIVLETDNHQKAVQAARDTPRPEGHPFNASIWYTTDLEKTRRKCQRQFGRNWLIGTSDLVQ